MIWRTKRLLSTSIAYNLFKLGIPVLDGRQLAHQKIIHAKCIARGHPCVIDNLLNEWPAFRDRRWSISNLRSLYGNHYFQCGTDELDQPVILSMASFLDRIPHADSFAGPAGVSNPNYLFDATFEEDCAQLLSDYDVPPIFRIAARDALSAMPSQLRPNFRWFLVGAPGSGSSLHVDPLATAAWNALVTGTKRWAMLGPAACAAAAAAAAAEADTTQGDSRAHQGADLRRPGRCCGAVARLRGALEEASAAAPQDGRLSRWFDGPWPALREAVAAAAAAAGGRCRLRALDFEQRAGQTVLVPAGWLHAVLNAAPAVAVTHNFVPPAGEPALLRALRPPPPGMRPAQVAACIRAATAWRRRRRERRRPSAITGWCPRRRRPLARTPSNRLRAAAARRGSS